MGYTKVGDIKKNQKMDTIEQHPTNRRSNIICLDPGHYL